MKLVPCFAVIAAMASLACRPPEYKALSQSPPVMEVAVRVAANSSDARDLEKEFAAALRARLASYATVVPEGAAPPSGALRLSVEIDKMSRRKIDSTAAGAGAAVALGAAHAVARGNSRHRGGGHDFFAVLDSVFFGLHVAASVEARQQYRAAYLGFVPPRITGLVSLNYIDGDAKRPLFVDSLKSGLVMDAMGPIRDFRDPAAVDAELARALAKVVTDKLKAAFDWRASDVPSWYEPPDSAQPD